MGPWIFATALILVTGYVFVHVPGSRKWFAYSLGALLAVVATIFAVFSYNEFQTKQKRALATTLIDFSEVVLSDMRLGESYGSWKLTGTITNKSEFTLEGFTYSVSLDNCPNKPKCDRVGQDEVSEVYLNVPPNQTRAVESYVNFSRLPPLSNWQWSGYMKEVRAKID